MKKILLSATAAVAMIPHLAQAEEPAPAPQQAATGDAAATAQDSQYFDTITVTAAKRDQSYMDVPASATVLNDTALTEMQATDAASYLELVPNVSFQEGGSGGAREIIISIRGISDQIQGERVAANSAFSTYWDGFSVQVAANGAANPPIYDVEAVEVLRGPQGTLFGRNSLGGAINIRSKKPTDELYGQLDLGAGTYNTFRLNGVVNLPVNDKMFIRTAFNNEKSDGFVKNVHPTGGSSASKLTSIRTSLRIMPSENTTIDAQVSYTDDRQDMPGFVPTCIRDWFDYRVGDPEFAGVGCHPVAKEEDPSLAGFPDNTDKTSHDAKEFTNNTFEQYQLNFNHDFDGFTVNNVTGYLATSMDQLEDLDDSFVTSIERPNNYSSTTFSNEFNVKSNGDGALDWVAGGLYYKDTLDAQNQIHIVGPLFGWLPGDVANENKIHMEYEGWAVFGDAIWQMTDRISLTGGLRFSKDKVAQSWTDVFAACGSRAEGDPLAEGCLARPDWPDTLPVYDGMISGGRMAQTAGTAGNTQSDNFSYRAAINYDISDDISSYATVSRGYKAATIRANPDAGFENISRADSEHMTNYEVGFKGTAFDNRARFEVAAFYMDWKNMQVPQRESLCDNGSGTLVPLATVTNCAVIVPYDRIANVPKAHSKGIELSLSTYLTDDFIVGGTVGYLNARYDDYFDERLTLAEGQRDRAGDRIDNGAPDWTGNAFARYNFEALEGDAFVQGNVYFRSGQQTPLSGDNFVKGYPNSYDGYAVARFSAGIEWDNQSLVLNVNNLLKNNYHTATLGGSYLGTNVDVHPRTAMLTWSIKS